MRQNPDHDHVSIIQKANDGKVLHNYPDLSIYPHVCDNMVPEYQTIAELCQWSNPFDINAFCDVHFIRWR